MRNFLWSGKQLLELVVKEPAGAEAEVDSARAEGQFARNQWRQAIDGEDREGTGQWKQVVEKAEFRREQIWRSRPRLLGGCVWPGQTRLAALRGLSTGSRFGGTSERLFSSALALESCRWDMCPKKKS